MSEALKEIEDEQPLIPADGEQARQADRAHAEDSDEAGEPKLDPEVAATRVSGAGARAEVRRPGAEDEGPAGRMRFDEALRRPRSGGWAR